MLTNIIRFAFFHKALPTSLPHANFLLSRFLSQKVQRDKYEEQLSTYQWYLQRILIENPQVNHHKVSLFDHTTKIYSIYRIPTQKLNKLHNSLAQQCLSYSHQSDPHALPNILLSVHRYNHNKSIALFKANKTTITNSLRTYPVPVLLILIKFLKEAKIDDAVIRQTCVEVLYKQLEYLNELQLVMVCSYLCLSKKYINKDFLVKFAQRVERLYRSGNLSQNYLIPILSNLSQIEVNLHTRSIYLQEMDQLYDLAFPSLFSNINSLDDRHLNQLTSALRRSKYYNQTMLTQLMETTFKRDIVELVTDEPRNKHLLLTLSTFVNIVNALAVFNYSVPQFKQYVLSIIKVLSLHKQDLLSPPLFSRLVWSACVLYERSEVGQIYPLIERQLSKQQSLPLHEAMNFYYCYLYLRTAYPKINDHRQQILKSLQNFTLQTQTSLIQIEAFQVFKSLGVPCLMEYNLNNLICDFMIPQWKNLRNVVIEFHGFRHFFRNAKKLTGSSILKEKIIRGEMYKYYFISIDEWLIAHDKKQFLSHFIHHINDLQGPNQEQASLTARTSTRVRSRPRVFRISSS